jgi:hypothetical protein
MSTEIETTITRLLTETLGAHSIYEMSVLGGVYDEQWSDWYASYLLGHGLPDLLPNLDRTDPTQLSAILKQLDTDYRRDQPDSEWPSYYAERLGAMVESLRTTNDT